MRQLLKKLLLKSKSDNYTLITEQTIINKSQLMEPAIDTIIAKYSVGPVNFTLYKHSSGLARLQIKEPPEPDEIVMKEIISGLRPPKTIEERYYYDKYKSGYGRIYPLIIDPHIEEIAIDGPFKPVAVIHRFQPSRWIDVDIYLTREETDSLALQLARKAGRIISIASPYAEGLTEEGHRIAVTFTREISRFGSTAVIRKYPDKPITMADLIASKVISPLAAAYLWILAEARGFIIIIGNMGSGKTTLLQAIAGMIPPYHRIITIEDTPEIRLPHTHWDSLVARPSTPGGEAPEITLEELLKFSLRRRADHIIVGEVRGREAKLLAQAAASGHGTITTFHADSAEGALLRLRLEPINLPGLFIRIITAIVHVRRIPIPGGRAIRRLVGISEIIGEEPVGVFKWRPHGDYLEPSDPKILIETSQKIHEAWEKLGMPTSMLLQELEERKTFLEIHSGSPPETFYEKLREFYISKYGEASII